MFSSLIFSNYLKVLAFSYTFENDSYFSGCNPHAVPTQVMYLEKYSSHPKCKNADKTLCRIADMFCRYLIDIIVLRFKLRSRTFLISCNSNSYDFAYIMESTRKNRILCFISSCFLRMCCI